MTLFSSSKADLWGSFLLYLFIHTGTQMALLGITKIRPSSFVNLRLKLPFFILSFVYSFQNNLKTIFIPLLREASGSKFYPSIQVCRYAGMQSGRASPIPNIYNEWVNGQHTK